MWHRKKVKEDSGDTAGTGVTDRVGGGTINKQLIVKRA